MTQRQLAPTWQALTAQRQPQSGSKFHPRVVWAVCDVLAVINNAQAGIADHVWSIEEIVRFAPEPEAKKPGPCKQDR